MKNTILIISSLILAAGIAHAKPPRGGHDPAARLSEQLSLNADQTAQIEVIVSESRAMHEEQRGRSQETFCAIRAEAEAQMMDVFNEDQQIQFVQLRQARESDKGKRDNRKGQGSGENTMDARRQGRPVCD